MNQPEAALQLVRARLDHDLDIAQAHSAELAKEEKPEFDSGAEDAGWSAEEVAWAFEKNPKIPLRKLIEDKNGWDTLPTLAEQAPSLFLEIQWPWFERCFEALGASPTSPTQRELCRFSLFSTTQVIELLNPCTPNSPQYRL